MSGTKLILKSSLLFVLFVLLNNTISNAQWLYFPVGSNGDNGLLLGDLDVSGTHITIEGLGTMKSPSTIWYDIVTKHSNNVNCNYYLRTRDFAIRTTNAFVSLLNPRVLCPDSTYHFAGTYDGDSIRYFVNGVQVASAPLTGTMVLNNLNTVLGNIYPSSGYFEQFIGYLDEVRIWNVARTSQQLSANMYNLPNPASQPGLVAYYKPGVNYNNLQGNVSWNGTPMPNSTQFSSQANPYFTGTISHGFCCPSSPPIPVITASTMSLCNGDSVLLTSSSASQYLWSTGETTRSIYVHNGGLYTVTISNAAGCTSSSVAFSITILSQNTAITGDSIFCAGDSSLLTCTGTGIYLWSTGATTKSIYVKSAGNYSVTLTNSNGCTAVSPAKIINVEALPIVSFNLDSLITCNKYVVSFHNTSTAVANSSYLWSFGDGSFSSDENPVHNYSALGNFNIKLTVTSPNGCISSNTSSIHIVAFQSAVANFTFTPSPYVLLGDIVLFNNLSQNANTYQWTFGDSTASSDKNPYHTFLNAGTYHVQLISYVNNCYDTAVADVTVLPWIFPNIFTPNGDDVNEVFPEVVFPENMKSFSLKIFNRWGLKVFESSVPNENFDGKNCTDGSYAFIISFESATGWKFKKHGFVTLVR